MGREVKRVSLDFEWPLRKVWGGYINHFYELSTECPHCEGRGYSPEARHLHDQWYGNSPFRPEDRGSVPLKPDDEAVWAFASRNVSSSPEYYGRGDGAIMHEAQRLCRMWNGQWNHHLNADDVAALVQAERLYDLTHEFRQGEGWKPKEPFVIPTPKQVNDWNILTMGHDSINAWVCVEAECSRHDWPTECSHCDKDGRLWPFAEARKAYEDWESTEPPCGEGWQMWETTSEGSPISPVFATPEELARWLANTGASSCGSDTASYDQWFKMITGSGWAMSAVMDGKGFRSGVEAMADLA